MEYDQRLDADDHSNVTKGAALQSALPQSPSVSPLEKVVDDQDPLDEKEHVNQNEDGGWGWVVVAASFLCVFILDGIGYSFGVFLEPLLADIVGGRGVLSMAGSMQVGVYGFFSPVVAKIIQHYGERIPCIVGAVIAAGGLLLASFASDIWILLLGYSVITGIGFGLMYIPSVVIVAKHFFVRRSLATSIVLCAAGVGTFAVAPVTQLMVDQWGWRGAMRGLAIMCLLCVLCGAVMTPGTVTEVSGFNIQLRRETVNRPCLARVLGSDLANSPAIPVVVFLMMGDMLATLSLYIPYTHLPSAAMSTGVSASNSALLVSAIGVTNSLGRLLSGWMSDQSWGHPVIIITTVISCTVPTLYLFSVVGSFWLFLFLSVGFGFLTGMWVAATPPALVQLLGVGLLGPAFGVLTALRGTAALAGPPIGGLVVDMLDDKRMALVVAGGGMTLSGVFYIIATMVNKRIDSRGRGYEEI